MIQIIRQPGTMAGRAKASAKASSKGKSKGQAQDEEVTIEASPRQLNPLVDQLAGPLASSTASVSASSPTSESASSFDDSLCNFDDSLCNEPENQATSAEPPQLQAGKGKAKGERGPEPLQAISATQPQQQAGKGKAKGDKGPEFLHAEESKSPSVALLESATPAALGQTSAWTAAGCAAANSVTATAEQISPTTTNVGRLIKEAAAKIAFKGMEAVESHVDITEYQKGDFEPALLLGMPSLGYGAVGEFYETCSEANNSDLSDLLKLLAKASANKIIGFIRGDMDEEDANLLRSGFTLRLQTATSKLYAFYQKSPPSLRKSDPSAAAAVGPECV